MGCGMLVRGVIAAADMPAGQANAQVDPLAVDFQAILTARRAGVDVFDLTEVTASVRIELAGLDQSIEAVLGMDVGG